jgi:hypothetical protein
MVILAPEALPSEFRARRRGLGRGGRNRAAKFSVVAAIAHQGYSDLTLPDGREGFQPEDAVRLSFEGATSRISRLSSSVTFSSQISRHHAKMPLGQNNLFSL